MASALDAGTVLLTSGADAEASIDAKTMSMLVAALNSYDAKKNAMGAYTLDNDSLSEIDVSRINELAINATNTLASVLEINQLVRLYVLTNDIIGRVYEALIEASASTFTLNYPTFDGERNKTAQVQRVSALIDDFNSQVNLSQVIRDAVPLVYLEGNRIYYLRYDKGAWAIDQYPFGIFYQSEYTRGGKPIVLCDINKLKNGLRKTYQKSRKTNKALLLANIEEDMRENYPSEVYDGYKNSESYVKMDTTRCRVIRIGNLGRRFGVSPIFKSLKSAIMLDNIEQADQINSKAKAKKIIHQVMRKEILGPDGSKKGFADMSFAHSQLMDAWQNKTVVYTSPPSVEKIVYVEPEVADTTAEKINEYRSRILSALGIGFVDSNVDNFSVAKISFQQLLKLVSSISEQMELVINDFYRVVLSQNGIDPKYAPKIKITDSEEMSAEMRRTLATFVVNVLNGSYRTAYELVGLDYTEEKNRREKENESGDTEVFYARQTAYTGTGEGSAGRPESNENTDKQQEDKARNEVKNSDS